VAIEVAADVLDLTLPLDHVVVFAGDGDRSYAGIWVTR
jgi:uncharacterized LabA/DUF88 family protein